MRFAVLAALLLALVSTPGSTQVSPRITSPLQQWGANVGDDYFLASYSQLTEYWQTLARESDRLALADIGRTEEGRTQWMAIVTAPENFARLDRYRQISRELALGGATSDDQARALAAEGRAVVWINGGLHADETVGHQQLIELVYQLVSRNDAETLRFLRDVIVLIADANPDGHELVATHYMGEPVPQKRTLAGLPRLYQKYAGHDNNRDFYMVTQAETVNINRVLYREWFPQIVYDHHQSGPDGTVMFAPPFREPYNYVFDPLIPISIDLVAASMHARFAAEGKAGVTMRAGSDYSAWWNGGLRTTAYFHNQIGLLTEIVGGPAPTRIPYVERRQRPSADLPNPIGPQPWRFRQSIDYSITANRAVLDAASRNRELLLYNVHRMARNAIARGSQDSWTPRPHRPGRGNDPSLRDPRAYVLPADQPDFPTATKFVNALIRNGVTVEQADAPFGIGSRRYPPGSYIVRTAQAFRPHVLDMFEPQDYPDQVPAPGQPPTPPYDSAGWTLAFQMGIAFDRVLDPFAARGRVLADVVAPLAGEVRNAAGAAGFVISHRVNDAFVLVNRLLAAGEQVYWLRDGSNRMYVPARAATLAILRKAAAELGLHIEGVATAPGGEALQLRPVRVALWDDHRAPESGWIRWILERFEFRFERIAPEAIDASLRSRFDVLILPGATEASINAAPLRTFAAAGGTVIAIGKSSLAGVDLGLPIVNAVGSLPRSQYYVPGSIVRARVDVTHPLAAGLGPEVNLFFDDSPAFKVIEKSVTTPSTVAWFSSAQPLRSGWAWGQEALQGKAAVLDVPLGRGRMLLFGPEITFRAQSHGTFKFLFNGIYYPLAAPARLP